MERASSLFHERVLTHGVPSENHRYRKALFHLLWPRLAACAACWPAGPGSSPPGLGSSAENAGLSRLPSADAVLR
jgi:hypothetical protein